MSDAAWKGQPSSYAECASSVSSYGIRKQDIHHIWEGFLITVSTVARVLANRDACVKGKPHAVFLAISFADVASS